MNGFKNKIFNPKESNVIKTEYPLSEIPGIGHVFWVSDFPSFQVFTYIYIVRDETQAYTGTSPILHIHIVCMA